MELIDEVAERTGAAAGDHHARPHDRSGARVGTSASTGVCSPRRRPSLEPLTRRDRREMAPSSGVRHPSTDDGLASLGLAGTATAVGTAVAGRGRRTRRCVPRRRGRDRRRRRRVLMRALSAVVGALLEAWQRVRVHRTRVLLSLVGVAVAVCSLTTVVASARSCSRPIKSSSERQSGRPASLSVSAYRTDGGTSRHPRSMAAWNEVVRPLRHRLRQPRAAAHAGRALPRRHRAGRDPGRRPALRRDAPRADERGRVVHRPRRPAAGAAHHRQRDLLGRLGRPPLESHPVVALGGQGRRTLRRGSPPAGCAPSSSVSPRWRPGRPSHDVHAHRSAAGHAEGGRGRTR